MKIKLSVIIALLVLVVSSVDAQVKKPYFTSGGEIIFSFASIDNNGDESGNIMRFSPWFNLQSVLNYDLSNNFGLYSGLSLRNVGFIYDVPNTSIRMKYRNYTVGIPVGFKIGNLGKAFLYGGYEIEFPINYKEKMFENEKKEDKFNVWFSKRVPTFYNTLMVGIQFPYGANLKFKYYLTSFHNKDFKETVDGVETKPYANLESNVFYVSLCFDLFKNADFVPPTETENTKSAYLY